MNDKSDMIHTKECTYRNNHDFRHDNCFCICHPKNEKKKGNLKPELRKNELITSWPFYFFMNDKEKIDKALKLIANWELKEYSKTGKKMRAEIKNILES